MKLTFELVVKANCPPRCGWASPNPLRGDWTEQKGRGKENLPSHQTAFSFLGVFFWSFPALGTGSYTINSPASQAFGLGLDKLYHWLSWVVPACRLQSVRLLSLHNELPLWTNSLYKISLHIFYWFFFSGEPWLK